MPSFKYRHMGSFAYIGGDKAVLDPAYKNGNVGPLKGWLMGFAWKVRIDFTMLPLTWARELHCCGWDDHQMSTSCSQDSPCWPA